VASDDEAETLVREFCTAFETLKADVLRPFFTDDVVYHNVPIDPCVGIEATLEFIESFFGMCDRMTIETTHLAVRGDVVLTERVDTFYVGDVVAPLPVMGTMELRDGKIAAWRDYGDLGQITAALSGAV
jgi:limonene-1,2-epoxide hydrolase